MPRCRSVASALALLAVLAAASDARADLTGRAHLRITGGGLSARDLERVPAPAGDVNGDGLDDLLVGAPSADPQGRRDAGSTFVVFGRRASASIDLDRLGDAGIRIDGRPPVAPVELDLDGVTGEASGSAVAALGDVDGDGLDDVAIGAPLASASTDRLLSGAAYVVYGRRAPGTIDLAAAGSGAARVDGPAAFAQFGDTLAGLTGPDPRLAIGMLGRIRVLPVTALPRGGALDLPLAGVGHAIEGYDEGDFNPFYAEAHRARRLGAGPDADEDGRAELLIGPGNDDVEGVSPDESPYETSGFVVLGGDPVDLARLGPAGLRIDDVGVSTGEPLLSAGDAGGARAPDLLLAHTARGGRVWDVDGGPACVLLDRVGGYVKTRTTPRGIRCLPGGGSDAVAAPGDVDGDGRRDIAITRFRDGREAYGPLEVYAVHPRVRRLARIAPGRDEPQRLGAAGDLDGDRRGDLVVRTPDAVLVLTARTLRAAT